MKPIEPGCRCITYVASFGTVIECVAIKFVGKLSCNDLNDDYKLLFLSVKTYYTHVF